VAPDRRFLAREARVGRVVGAYSGTTGRCLIS
jgi:hypothetical protein